VASLQVWRGCQRGLTSCSTPAPGCCAWCSLGRAASLLAPLRPPHGWKYVLSLSLHETWKLHAAHYPTVTPMKGSRESTRCVWLHAVPHSRSTYPRIEHPHLLQILREVGLKHKVDDAETFTACAQRVAANWADAAVSYEPAAAAAAAMKVRSRCASVAARLDVSHLPHSIHYRPCSAGNQGVMSIVLFTPACRLQSCWQHTWRPRPMRCLRLMCSTSWAASPSCRRPGCVALLQSDAPTDIVHRNQLLARSAPPSADAMHGIGMV
jgi:hypothetical protein